MTGHSKTRIEPLESQYSKVFLPSLRTTLPVDLHLKWYTKDFPIPLKSRTPCCHRLMAKSDLRSILANAKRVHDMLEDSDNLPEWVQSKITTSRATSRED